MIRCIAASLIACALGQDTPQPPTLESYLPPGQSYDADFPRPESVLGWPVGRWHVRHDQLVRWFEVVAERSPRVTLERMGLTHEQRPLLLATITAPENQGRIEALRQAHLDHALGRPSEGDGPTVIWMGYGVHGDESSGSNAALLLLYHLAAATGPEIDAFLRRTIVLIDPCVNPDGGARFAHWANMHRGQNLVGDPSHREHQETWPGGRTNHYWFDLNRDWLLLTHPESRARVNQFQRWRPHVLTDYHEMGSGSTYFFQPGIPSRRNPLTPARNHELTAEIARFHGEALDAEGSLYFTEEAFDDFYYGKGSTYPDVQGSIGILFEQASSRGHLMNTERGELTFPFTIRNQFTTSLSTLRAADALRSWLATFQREFYLDAAEEAAALDFGGYVFGDSDHGRTREMVDRLRQHHIRVRRLARDYGAFGAAHSYVVPVDQPQSRLIRALFETRTSWDDNTFYDVSAWTFPLSFDVPYAEVPRADWPLEMAATDAAPAVPGTDLPVTGAVAYAFPWGHLHAPRLLHALQRRGIEAKVATEEFEVRVRGSERTQKLARGTILVTVGTQELERAEVLEALRSIESPGFEIVAIDSGMTPDGPDLGSGSFTPLRVPKPLLLVGDGVSVYGAGEVWHELDTRVGMAVPMVERAGFEDLDLGDSTHLILVSGATSGWGDAERDKLEAWVRAGGHVVGIRHSAVWLAETLMGNRPAPEDLDETDEQASEGPKSLAYGDYRDLRAGRRVAGTIFQVSVDRTHPLAFGFSRDRLPVFRNFEQLLPEGLNPFGTPLRYSDAPLLSGFASEENVARIAGSPALRVERMGAGTVIAMVDDPVFRGVWYGTRRLLLNALFFADAVRRTGPLDAPISRGGD